MFITKGDGIVVKKTCEMSDSQVLLLTRALFVCSMACCLPTVLGETSSLSAHISHLPSQLHWRINMAHVVINEHLSPMHSHKWQICRLLFCLTWQSVRGLLSVFPDPCTRTKLLISLPISHGEKTHQNE